MFYDSLGNLPEAIEPEAIHLANILYFGFAGGVCTLLERWQEVSDLSEETIKTIDYTLYYWKPPSVWLDKSFHPSCFEKYLAAYWKGKLPKMLLTFNVHEVFDGHLMKKNCCTRYALPEILFDQSESNDYEKHSLKVMKIFSPVVVFCKAHNDCYVKIQHDANCLEPYVCLGSAPCLTTCETAGKVKMNKNKDHLKNSSVKVFTCKKKNLRDVSTHVESSDRQIETYCPLEENFHNSVSLCMEDLICFNNDPHLKNSMSQQKRKEDYRRKLRKKLCHKYVYDVYDPLQLKCMYDEAERLWAQELCAESFKSLFKNSSSNCDKKGIFEKTLSGVKRALTSVATGTSDVIFGRVVLSSKQKLYFNQITSDEAKLQSDIVKQSKGRKRKEPKTVCTASISKSKSTVKSEQSSIDYRVGADFGESRGQRVLAVPCSDVNPDTDQEISKTGLCRVTEQKTTNLDKQSLKPPICPQTTKHGLFEDKQQHTETNLCAPNQLTNKSNVCEVNLQSLKGIFHKVDQKHMPANLSEFRKADEVNSCKVEKSLDNKKGVLGNILETKSDNDEELATFYNFVSTEDVPIASPSLSDGLCFPVEESGKKIRDSATKKSKLKTCAFCLKKETECKTFKRCSRCKAEHLLDQYYYCSRECQIADWEKSHKEMHAKKN